MKIIIASCVAAVLIGVAASTALFRVGSHNHSTLPARSQSAESLLGDLLIKGKEVFISPEFFPLIKTDQATLVPSKEESLAACRNVPAFYQLNRAHHYAAILIGPSSSSLPLTDGLLSSPLWVLADVSPWGCLFRPAGAASWQPPKKADLELLLPDQKERTWWLIATANNLIGIGLSEDAEQLLAAAALTRQHRSFLLATRASLAASRAHWNEAMTLSRESLDCDRSNSSARGILVRSLTECGQSDEALNEARKLVANNGNQETLFLLARAANAANSREEEIDALRRLVLLGQKNNQPLGASLTYLGQAYAKSGQRGEALRTFQRAMASPELTEQQRHLLHELMDHLMEGNADSSSLPPLEQSGPPSN